MIDALGTPRYSMLIEWSDEDQAYLVTLPERADSVDFGGPVTHGATGVKPSQAKIMAVSGCHAHQCGAR